MRVLFCGGGTAGHIYPNLAIAETIKNNVSKCKFAYVVTEKGMENSLVHFKKYPIDVMGLKGISIFHNAKAIAKAVKAQKDCESIIREFRPDIIIGTGGYASFPVIKAGYKLGVRIALHESNAVPGKAIKALEKYANRVFVNFEETKNHLKFKDKIVRVGNPLRNGYEVYDKERIKSKLGIKEKHVIVCFGGSLGSHMINKATADLIKNLVQYEKDIRLIWGTGKREYFDIKRSFEEDKRDFKNVEILDFIHNMPEAIACADLVICRAGAITLSELATSKKCSILVPSPNVADNHQYKNAKLFSDSKAAIMLTEEKLYELIDTVKDLLLDGTKRKELEENIAFFSSADANKLMFNEIVKILNYK